MITVEITRKKPLHFQTEIRSSSPRCQQGLSFHNCGNLGGQLKTRYDDAFGVKRKGDLYHKRTTILAIAHHQ